MIPDLRGELVLQIFPDIHGHTRAWWSDGEHPGLVYNEHGQVIRLGTFADIAAHPATTETHLRLHRHLSAGSPETRQQPRGLVAPRHLAVAVRAGEPGGDGASLGGNDGLRALVAAAHELEMKVLVDLIPHLNRRVQGRTRVAAGAMLRRPPATWCRAPPPTAATGAGTTACCSTTGAWRCGRWLADALRTLLERFDVDGVRCDIAHALPIMMKRNNAPVLPTGRRSDEDQVRAPSWSTSARTTTTSRPGSSTPRAAT